MEDDKKIKLEDDKKIKMEDDKKNQNEKNKVNQYNLIKNITQFCCGTTPSNLVSANYDATDSHKGRCQ